MKKLLCIALSLIMIAALLTACTTSTTTTTSSSGGGAYAELSMIKDVKLGLEEYGIAFRAGSDMVAKVDEITADLYKDGTIAAIAEKYNQTDKLITPFVASTDSDPAEESDWEYIKANGKMVIGVTDFDPMDYMDENGKWIGFDAEYAEAVCAKLGITAEFKEIDWDNKELELQTKSIDCIWNGMTITDAILEAADVTGAYLRNYQVVVVKDAATYTSLESLKGKVVVAESGSAGETAAQDDENLSVGYKAVGSQADALLQVKSGAADACVIDYIMAESMLNK